jgi:hypothetical protein
MVVAMLLLLCGARKKRTERRARQSGEEGMASKGGKSGQRWAEEGGRVEALAGRERRVAADSWRRSAARAKAEEKKWAGADRWVPLVRFENCIFC